MKPASTLFLKIVIFLLGLAVATGCIYAVYFAITWEVSYYRPLLIGILMPAIPFFMALVQAYRLLNLIDQNNAFSKFSIKILKNIKYCAIAISAMYAAGLPYIFYVANKDDSPGVIALGLVVVFASIVVATFAAVLQKLLQDALLIKSENDLTV